MTAFKFGIFCFQDEGYVLVKVGFRRALTLYRLICILSASL